MTRRYFDIHSHIAAPEFASDVDALLAQMEHAGIRTTTIGVDLASSRDAVRLAERSPLVYASVGQHPADNPAEHFDLNAYRDLIASSERIVAIGECGLDYYRLEGDSLAERRRQRSLFEAQVDLARECGLPLMIHARTRAAHDDVIAILRDTAGPELPLRGNVHFFTEPIEVAARYYDLGCSTSFTGVITFTHDYDDVVAYAPADRICVETDAPYAAPVPHRGKRNDPTYVPLVVERVAALRIESEETVANMLVANAHRLFGIGDGEKYVNQAPSLH